MTLSARWPRSRLSPAALAEGLPQKQTCELHVFGSSCVVRSSMCSLAIIGIVNSVIRAAIPAGRALTIRLAAREPFASKTYCDRALRCSSRHKDAPLSSRCNECMHIRHYAAARSGAKFVRARICLDGLQIATRVYTCPAVADCCRPGEDGRPLPPSAPGVAVSG